MLKYYQVKYSNNIEQKDLVLLNVCPYLVTNYIDFLLAYCQ